jgi:hypothetical protein
VHPRGQEGGRAFASATPRHRASTTSMPPEDAITIRSAPRHRRGMGYRGAAAAIMWAKELTRSLFSALKIIDALSVNAPPNPSIFWYVFAGLTVRLAWTGVDGGTEPNGTGASGVRRLVEFCAVSTTWGRSGDTVSSCAHSLSYRCSRSSSTPARRVRTMRRRALRPPQATSWSSLRHMAGKRLRTCFARGLLTIRVGSALE